MRIRENRKFLALMFPSVHHLQPYDCQLNQSPWDAIPFYSNPDFDFNSYLLQFGRVSRFIGGSNANISSVERELPEAVNKKVNGDDDSERTITAEKDEQEMEKNNEEVESKPKRLRSRSKRTAAKNPRWLNSKSKDFYYYFDFGLLKR